MGVVYRGRDTLLERDVAVKVLSATDLGSEGRARLLNEARAAAQLDHPNIVAVHDVGGADDGSETPFIVMQLVQGESLYKRRPSDLNEVLSIARQICAALDHAHAHGIVHRDIKPENVLLAQDGTAKLMDFGLARPAAARLSDQGIIVGTVYYLAPELALGREFDGRADLYALGVMLYELTTDHLPFTGDDPLAVISQHLHAPVIPPSERKPEIAQWPALDDLIVQLLSKQAEDRPASAAEVEQRLANLAWPKEAVEFRVERPSNLPAQATPFIGREAQLAAVRKELTRPEVRLLTLTGTGGTGKTRLALQVAADLIDQFEDGVFFVALAPIRDPALLIPAVAHTLGVLEGEGKRLLEQLKDHLRNKNMLLVLDNFEQVVQAAPKVSELLTAAPQLKVLVTSRSLLQVYGEHDYQVPPLTVPDPSEIPPIEALTQYEAVELFVQRAQAVRADFALTDENGSAVAQMCARLDGLPLAIELAAARVRLLRPQSMLTHMDNRFRFLTGGARDLPARHQSLHATIDWSYDLLNPDEKAFFQRLAVFVGGFTLQAADAVCSFSGDLDALNGLGALVDQSLLKPSGVYGEPRFSMLETIHEFALEKLAASGELDAVQRRHADFYLAVAEQAEPLLEGPDQAIWLDRLEIEHENIRASLIWAEENEQVNLGMRLASALCLFWFMRGHLTEGRERLAVVLSLRQKDQDPRLRSMCLDKAGLLARYQGDFDEAYTLIKESLDTRRVLGDPHRIADSFANLAYVVLHQGDYSQARALYGEALAINRHIDNAQGVADTLSHLALIALFEGDSETALALDQESLQIWRELGDQVGVAWALHKLGNVVLYQGDYVGALDLFVESLETAREVGFKLGITNALEGLASVAAAERQSDRALRLAGVASSLRQEIRLPLPPAGQEFFERTLAPAKRALSPEEAAAAWELGHAMALEDAIQYALEGAAKKNREADADPKPALSRNCS